MVATGFPELNVKIPARSVHTPVRGYWKDLQHQRELFQNIASKLGMMLSSLKVSGIREHVDWYSVSYRQILLHGGASVMNLYDGSLSKTLNAVFPAQEFHAYRYWRPHHVPPHMKSTFSKTQGHLFQIVKRVSFQDLGLTNCIYFLIMTGPLIIPLLFSRGALIMLNSTCSLHSSRLPWSTMGSTTIVMCLCILQWCLFTHCSHEELKKTQERDYHKMQLCESMGITLLTIPYWWNRKMESVANEIHIARPDVPIPTSLLNHDTIPKEIPTQKEIKRTLRDHSLR